MHFEFKWVSIRINILFNVGRLFQWQKKKKNIASNQNEGSNFHETFKSGEKFVAATAVLFEEVHTAYL